MARLEVIKDKKRHTVRAVVHCEDETERLIAQKFNLAVEVELPLLTAADIKTQLEWHKDLQKLGCVRTLWKWWKASL